MTTIAYCQTCANYLGEGSCLAYPERIPEQIFRGDAEHTSTRPDQTGDGVYTPTGSTNALAEYFAEDDSK
jgi:hypothetical protein